MNLQEIKNAVDHGEVVKWVNDSYTVIKKGEYYVIEYLNTDYSIGLTWNDMKTLNGNESDFYIYTSTLHI